MQGIDFTFIWWLLLTFFLLLFITPMMQRRVLVARRASLIREIEQKRATRVITLIHRQEVVSLLGIPLSRYIDVEDSVDVLRAIRLTDPKTPIDLVVHTPGGLVFAAQQIAMAMHRHPGKVTVVVPHYAMSGGTLLALAADEVLMDTNAVLGPVDPQIPAGLGTTYPAASIMAALRHKNPNRDDRTLILGDIARKATAQVEEAAFDLLAERMGKAKARRTAKMLVEGDWTHDRPITPGQAREMGLPVSTELPAEFHLLLELYPQPTRRMATVEYLPGPYPDRERSPKGERSRGK